MLAALPEVAMNGIDYSSTESALQEIREESTHLARFAREVGLDYQIGGRISGGELWEVLRQWYIDNGYLEIEKDTKGKEKLNWLDSGSRQDRLVTSSNKVIARVLELFPQAKRDKDDSRATGHPGRAYIQGIGFVGQASNAQKFVYESITSKIDYLSVEECKLLISKLTSRIDAPAQTQQAQQPHSKGDSCLVTDSAHGSTVPHQISAENTTTSPSGSLNSSPICDTSSVVVNPAVSVGVSGEGDVVAGNSTKNFASPDSPKLRPGDRVKVNHASIYGIPANRALTIVKIEGELATVTFKGCRSVSGCEVPLSELRYV